MEELSHFCCSLRRYPAPPALRSEPAALAGREQTPMNGGDSSHLKEQKPDVCAGGKLHYVQKSLTALFFHLHKRPQKKTQLTYMWWRFCAVCSTPA